MTTEEAYAEMKRRGWGFAKYGFRTAVGPIKNPNYLEKGEAPIIEVLAMDIDPAIAVELAIKGAEHGQSQDGTPVRPIAGS